VTLRGTIVLCKCFCFIFSFRRLPSEFNTEINDNTKSLIEKSNKLLANGKNLPTLTKLKFFNDRILKHLPAKDACQNNLGEASGTVADGQQLDEDKNVPLDLDGSKSSGNDENQKNVHEFVNGSGGSGDGLQHEVVNKKARYTSPLEYRYQKR
jgi:hypothetical protein